jgi:hypothetical protein
MWCLIKLSLVGNLLWSNRQGNTDAFKSTYLYQIKSDVDIAPGVSVRVSKLYLNSKASIWIICLHIHIDNIRLQNNVRKQIPTLH